MMIRARAVLAVAAIIPGALFAQSVQVRPASERFAQLQDELRRAHESGNTAAYLAASQKMYSFLNGSPRATLQLMSAQTAAGNPDAALRSFRQFVSMGQADEEVLNAKSFDPLRGLPKFRSLHGAMAANTAAKSAAEEVFRLEETGQIPEDIDYDSETQHFYISTVLGKQILEVSMAGRSRVFADAPDHWPLMALKIDVRRRILWATEVALDGFTAAAQTDWGRSAILQYDLRSGRLLHRIEGPPKAALGDMALATNGNPLVSDGQHGGVYQVDRKTLSLVRIDAGDFVSPQTIAPAADGKRIFVPDYVRGIGVLDRQSKHVAWIPMQGEHALSGIDGLYTLGDNLLATQNGTSPERVVRFRFDASAGSIVAETLIERATATLGDPTHGVVVGEYFYYIANSGWNGLDEHGAVKEGSTLTRPAIMRAKAFRSD